MFMWRRIPWKDQKRNISVHYDEHEKPSKKSKPAAHLEKNSDQNTRIFKCFYSNHEA